MAREPRRHKALYAFRLDAETEAALLLLETAHGRRRARSAAIRAAIREAAARVVARQQRGAR